MLLYGIEWCDTHCLLNSHVQVNVTFASTDTHPLVVTMGFVDPAYNCVWLRVAATSGEQVYGLGEQFSYLNLRGRTYPIWTREQGK